MSKDMMMENKKNTSVLIYILPDGLFLALLHLVE
jgi:hypothetical protein